MLNYQMFDAFSLCLFGPAFVPYPADDPLTQLVLTGELHLAC